MYVIFMDLHKEYDALERDRCLDILDVFSMGPRARRILHKYWDMLRMVEHTVGGGGGYNRAYFKGFQGVTHGVPL